MKFIITLILLSTFYTNSRGSKEGFCLPNADGTGCEKEELDHKHMYSKTENTVEVKEDDSDDDDFDEDIVFEDDDHITDEDDNKETEEDIQESETKKEWSEEEHRKEFKEPFVRKIPIIPESYFLNEEQQIFYPKDNGEGLARRNGVEVGYKHVVEDGNNKKYEVITRSLKPLLFEIPNFLSDEECDHIIKRAKDPNEGGMFSSRAKGGLTPHDDFEPTGKKGRNAGPFGNFTKYDTNEDDVITIDEIISIAHRRKIITMLESDVKEMFVKMKTDVMDDGKITFAEFQDLDTIGLEEYLDVLWRENPRFKERHSQQAWLFMEQWIDPMVHNIRERLVAITGLSRRVIYGGEMLQVVHYKPFGHYHAHHDSETHTRPHIPCCHQYTGDVLESVGLCKLCRYLTFIMYLNDVEEGGETAFPVADNSTYNENQLRHHGNTSADKYNLSHGCKRASLVVKPKKGSAILWYNHHLNETNGWMGELDLFSLHGGCDVKKGEKWLSNMWIPASYETAKHKDSIYLNQRDFELAEEAAKEKDDDDF